MGRTSTQDVGPYFTRPRIPSSIGIICPHCPGVSSVGALSESGALKTLALIPGPPVYPSTTTNDGVVMVFDDVYFQQQAQFALQPFTVNGASFAAHGKWLFYNAASTQLIAVMQAASKSGLLNSFAIEQIPVNAPLSMCGAAFAARLLTRQRPARRHPSTSRRRQVVYIKRRATHPGFKSFPAVMAPEMALLLSAFNPIQALRRGAATS